MSGGTSRVLLALAGLHRVHRGAEVAFQSVGRALARLPGFEVTLIGSGPAPAEPASEPYRFISAPCSARERFESWPRVPPFRSELVYEEFAFARSMWQRYDPGSYDATITCAYPFTNWALRAKKRGARRPAHIYVTQNGDWAPQAKNREYKRFGCDGLVCTNPEYYERHRARYRSALIPNGVDAGRFTPGASVRRELGLPEGMPIVLICAALIASKRVDAGVRAVAALSRARPDVRLLVAGDGPMRESIDALGKELLGDRYQRMTLRHEQMPGLYRSVDALLHMSRDEPFGNIYLEALASGLPVVAHDNPSSRWIMEDRASLVDTGDMDATAAALGGVLGDRARVEDRRELILRRFDWPVVASAYAAFVREVISGRAAGANA